MPADSSHPNPVRSAGVQFVLHAGQLCTVRTEVEFLKSEELSLINSSALPAQLARPGRS